MPQVDLDKYLTIEDELSLEADEYRIGVDVKNGEAKLEFRNASGVLSMFTVDAPEIYDLAQRLLRAYDQLEGL